MKIEYAGLKPIISEHGISFKDGKEDKYIYLSFAIEILDAITHDYEKNKKYSHQVNKERLTPNEISNILLKFHSNLEITMQAEIEKYEIHLDKEEDDINHRTTLSEIEKETFLNNLKIMRNYKTQRAKNKIFYFHCIQTIVETIIKNKIREIDAPFNERFWHIFQTIEGELSLHKISSKLTTTNENDTFKAMLNINVY